ncbi:MAG: ankyrin repeat domain-containing protein [Candidatus Kaiserbacteria bacterium]|nr:ankyrin repeat domain-containing protein [Candidatus Kaiserbacteria bacterium]
MSKVRSVFEAASRGNVPWLRQIIEKEKSAVLIRDGDGMTPLMYAVEQGRTKAVEILIQSGADPHTRDFVGDPVLFYALFGEEGISLEIVDLLMQSGVTVNSENKEGKTSIHIAAICDDVETSSFLVGMGADINKRDSEGRTPLFHAVSEDSERVTILLADVGAEIDQCDNLGRTALMIACQRKLPKVVDHLVNAGANVCKMDRSGKMPIDYFEQSEVIPRILCKKIAEDIKHRTF